MKITKTKIIFLAKKHFINLNEFDLNVLLFEFNNYTLKQTKQLAKFNVDQLQPTFLPHFIKNKTLRDDFLIQQTDVDNFFVNVQHKTKEGFIVIAKEKEKNE